MLKRIHFAKPTINYQEQKTHGEDYEKHKRRIMNGGNRYTMLHVARDVILKTDSGVGKQMRDKMSRKTGLQSMQANKRESGYMTG